MLLSEHRMSIQAFMFSYWNSAWYYWNQLCGQMWIICIKCSITISVWVLKNHRSAAVRGVPPPPLDPLVTNTHWIIIIFIILFPFVENGVKIILVKFSKKFGRSPLSSLIIIFKIFYLHCFKHSICQIF